MSFGKGIGGRQPTKQGTDDLCCHKFSQDSSVTDASPITDSFDLLRIRAVFRIAGAAAINLLFILTAAVLAVPVVLGFFEKRLASFLLATERSIVEDDDCCCCWDAAAVDSIGGRTC